MSEDESGEFSINRFIKVNRESQDTEDESTLLFPLRSARAPVFHSTKLSFLLANIYAVVLEQCLQKVSLIGSINRLPDYIVELEYIALAERYNEFHYNEDYLYDEEWQFAFCKFKRDIAYIKKVLHQTVEGLKMLNSFEDLCVVIKNHKMKQQNERAFIGSRNFNEQEIKNLRVALNKERKEMTAEIQELTAKVGQLKDLFNDSEAEYDVKMRYLKNWEFSRQEQNHILLQNKISDCTTTMERNDEESDKEMRVHEEILTYIEESKDDYQNQIEEWMERYNDEFEERENTINNMRINLERKKLTVTELEEEFERRTKAIADYQEHKRLMEIERKEFERQTKAATKIQAWWRGVMYRRCLGPYRKKKKGKKGGKNSGKKKK